MADTVTVSIPYQADLGLFNRHRQRCNCQPMPTGDQWTMTRHERAACSGARSKPRA